MAKECIVCNRPYSEEHHIIFRGQQSAMINYPYNKIIYAMNTIEGTIVHIRIEK